MLKIIFPLISLFLLAHHIKNTKHILIILTTIGMLIATLVLTNRIDQIIFSTPIWKADLIRTPLIRLTLWIRSIIIVARNTVYYNKDRVQAFTNTTLLLAIILCLAFIRGSLFNFYIFFEASLIPTLFLILGWGYQPERLQAGLYLIMYTITASLPLLIIISTTIKTNRHRILRFITVAPHIIKNIPELIILVLVGAFIVKIPLYFVHLWLPKAHVEAPVAGSIILAGLLLKLGRYGLIRIISLLPTTLKAIKEVFLPIRLVGAIITRLICIRQTDIKSLIAYSSVGHMALLVGGALSATTWGFEGALVLMVAHGLCSSGLFFLAYTTYTTTKTRRTLIVKGILNFFPIITRFWFLFSVFNIAAPPSINLLREIILITRIISISLKTIASLILIRFTAAVYSLILYTSLNHGYATQISNPINHYISRFYMVLLIHLIPIIIIISNPARILRSTC